MKPFVISAIASVLFISLLIFIYNRNFRTPPSVLVSPNININNVSNLANHPKTLRYLNDKYGFAFRYPEGFLLEKKTAIIPGVDTDTLISNIDKKADNSAKINITYNPQNCEDFYRQKLIDSQDLIKIYPYYFDAGSGLAGDTRYTYTKSERNGEQYFTYIFKYGEFCPSITVSLGKNVITEYGELTGLLTDTVEFLKGDNSDWTVFTDPNLPFTLNLPSGYQSSLRSQESGNVVIDIGSTVSANSLFLIQKVPFTGTLNDLRQNLTTGSVFPIPSSPIDSPPIPIALGRTPGILWIKTDNDTFFVYKNYAFNIKFRNLQAPYVYKILESIAL